MIFVGALLTNLISAMEPSSSDSKERKTKSQSFRPTVKPVPPIYNERVCRFPLVYDAKRDVYYFDDPRRVDPSQLPIQERLLFDSKRRICWFLDITERPTLYLEKESWCYELDEIMDRMGITEFEVRQSLYGETERIPKAWSVDAFETIRGISDYDIDKKYSIMRLRDCIHKFIPSGPQQDKTDK